MSYLNKLRRIQYPDPTDSNNTVRMRDVTLSVHFIERKLKDAYIQYYDLSDGERPEQVAHYLYGDPQHAWILLFLNGVVDPFFEWYLSEQQVIRLTKSKYDDINGIHHYEDPDGDWIDEDDVDNTEGTVPVTNLQYEYNENDKKRRIRYIDPRHLQNILSQLEKELGVSNNV